jgi:IS5 family transposase
MPDDHRTRSRMSTQRTFAGLAWSQKGKVTRRERFLAEMDAVIPWAQLVALIAPYYPKAGNGRQPLGLEKMLRIYFLQQWFNLSDPQAEDAIYDSESMRRFAGVELSEDVVPDETTILRFRHLLETHQLTEAIFATVRALLQDQHLLLQSGTIVDATIITAPSSTKNAGQARDPEMKQTRKGNTWYFGMKVHVGTDPRGLVHTLTTTDAAQADVTQLPALLHGAERAVYGDRAYWSEGWRQAFRRRGVRYRVQRRAAYKHPLSARWEAINRTRARIRARGEHAFLVVKRLWGFAKVRYRGLAKNTARAFTLFALANLYLVRHRLRPAGVTCLPQ